jgi:hypothetical protein
MSSNSDTLCPNEPKGISLYRWGLLPLASLKQIVKMTRPPSATPKKEFFGILSLRGNLRKAGRRKSSGLM